MAASDKVQQETADVNLGSLLDAGEGAVVTLIAGETHLVAHKAVLSARSPVFEAMFQHDMVEASSGRVSIPDVEGQVLRQLLVYVYTLQVPQLAGMALQLLVAADKYGLLALKTHCEQQVVAQLSMETAAAAAVFAVRHSCTSLRNAAVAFIRAHLEVMGTQEWSEVVCTHPEAVVEVSRLLTESTAESSAGAQSQRQSQPHSSHGQTPAAAAPPTPPHHTPSPEGGAASHLRSLSSEEKGRRLREAAKEGRVGDVEALLAAGADVGARVGDWWTVLYHAAYRGHVEVARRLLGGGAEVDTRDSVQQTPLHWAAWSGQAAVVRLLVAASADPNVRGKDGNTPLHYAALNGHAEAVAALLQAGADRAPTNNSGRTPLDLARQYDAQPVIQLLS